MCSNCHNDEFSNLLVDDGVQTLAYYFNEVFCCWWVELEFMMFIGDKQHPNINVYCKRCGGVISDVIVLWHTIQI